MRQTIVALACAAALAGGALAGQFAEEPAVPRLPEPIAQRPAAAAVVPGRPAPVEQPRRSAATAKTTRPAALAALKRSALRQQEAAAVFDQSGAKPQTPLAVAQQALHAVAGGKAKLSVAKRTAYFRSSAFRGWVASEKAAGRTVFWLKDIDKTQAAGDSFTYFFLWRALNGKITAEQNETMRAFLKTVAVSDPALQAELTRAGTNDARENALLVIKLWRAKERGGEGISLYDFSFKVYWPTLQGLTKKEKLEEARAFAPDYASKIYPGIPEENRALADAGVEVVAISNGDQDLAKATAGLLGLKPENVVALRLAYDKGGQAVGLPQTYDVFENGWGERPQPGKFLRFHDWLKANKRRLGWDGRDESRIVVAGADGDSAAHDGGMWVYFRGKPIGNFMVDTPHEPDRIKKSRKLARQWNMGTNDYFTLTHAPTSPKAWDDDDAPQKRP